MRRARTWALGLAGAWAALGLFSAPANGQTPGSAPLTPTAHGPGSLNGAWFNSDFSRGGVFDVRDGLRRTEEGKDPPYQPWAAAEVARRIKDADAGHPYADSQSQCLPSGMPAILFSPALGIQFIETPRELLMLIEELTSFRIVRMNAEHKPDPDPTFFGDAVGHWEGDTLVVDTIGLTTRTTLDDAGTPHSEAMHLIERYRRTGPDTMEAEVTIDDPKTFTAPWTAKTHFKALNRSLEEYFCENQRNLADVNGRTTTQLPSAGR